MIIPQVTVPEGTSGAWSVQRFKVTEEDSRFTRMQALISGRIREFVPAGHYTRLVCGGETIMSDTPSEIREHYPIIYRATGDVLMSGLGLGMALQACLLKPEVTSLTVVELSTDVIALVASHYTSSFGKRLIVVNADIREWKPPKGTRYDAAWHDIWSDICGDNWEEMKRLKRRFQPYAKWQGCWCERETRAVHKTGEEW